MIIPILFFGIVKAVSNEVGQITLKTIAVFIGMFAASFFINCIFVMIVRPGLSAHFTNVAWDGTLAQISLSDFALSLIPTNILSAALNN